MFYACVEDKQVISIVDYKPTVPDTVIVIPITEEEKQNIESGELIFDDQLERFRVADDAEMTVLMERRLGDRSRLYLFDTDWMVLRHLREQTLGIETTLTQEDYLQLELDRQRAAKSIK